MINVEDIMEYELFSNPLLGLVSNGFLQGLLGKYYAWKVRRKYDRYLQTKAMRDSFKG